MAADSHHEPVRLTSDDPLAGLPTWLAEQRVDAATAERARQRWLERQAAEDATLVGVLLDLAERERPVTARTTGARSVHGRVVALGADFVAIRQPAVGDLLIPTTSLATVRPAPGEPAAVGDRAVVLTTRFGDVLVELAADRPTVLVAVAGEDIRGDLRRAGRDVIAVELAHDVPRTVVSVAVAAIDHVVVLRR